MSDRFESELALQEALRIGLERQSRVFMSEFPLLGKIADFFVLDTDTCTAIECKLKDTGEAVRQARVYQEAADLVYIAMPKRRGPRGWDAQTNSYGYRAAEVAGDGCIEMIVKAVQGSPHPELRDRALAHLERRMIPESTHRGSDA